MTLHEFVNLLKPKFKWILIASVACGLVVLAGAYIVIPTTYQASASITTNTGVASMKGLADSIATTEYEGVTVTTAVTTANSTVTITGKGKNGDDCIKAVNEIVNETARLSEANLGNADTTVNTKVAEAKTFKDVTPKRYTYGLAGFCVVLFVCIAWIVFRDFLKRRIHSSNSVEHALEIPYIGEIGGTAAEQERMLAMTQHVGREGQAEAKSICLVPVGEIDTAEKAATMLREVSGDSALNIIAAKPLSTGANALLAASDADTALLAIKQEQSTFTDAELTVRELTLMGAKPAGFIYEAPSSKVRKQSKKKRQSVQE